jgi:hypothetical protein
MGISLLTSKKASDKHSQFVLAPLIIFGADSLHAPFFRRLADPKPKAKVNYRLKITDPQHAITAMQQRCAGVTEYRESSRRRQQTLRVLRNGIQSLDRRDHKRRPISVEGTSRRRLQGR